MTHVQTYTKMHALLEQGQSVWLDDLRCGMIVSGELDALIADGLRGMTSNPTIFEEAEQQAELVVDLGDQAHIGGDHLGAEGVVGEGAGDAEIHERVVDRMRRAALGFGADGRDFTTRLGARAGAGLARTSGRMGGRSASTRIHCLRLATWKFMDFSTVSVVRMAAAGTPVRRSRG